MLKNLPTNPPLTGLRIAESPQQDRPRERLQRVGARNLKTSELLAILIRSGRKGESAVQAGEKLAGCFSQRLAQLPEAGKGEMHEISSAVAETAYCQIMAGIELGRRVAEAKGEHKSMSKISSSESARRYCEEMFARLVQDAAQEEFHIVTLDTKNHVIQTHLISRGTIDASLVHPREVFRAAIKDSAASIILVHNHPSGDPTPSREDYAVTRRLEKAGHSIGIEIVDHIVLGSFSSVSIREEESD